MKPTAQFSRLGRALIVVIVCMVFISTSFQQVSARTIRLVMTQMGQGSGESTKQQAHDDGYQQAVDSLNNLCHGDMENVEETGVSYFQFGDDDNRTYSAWVYVRGTCVITGS